MVSKPAPKPKLTDAERHKRFVDMAREIGAEETTEAFDRAFARVTSKPSDSQTRRTDRKASS